MGKELHCGEQCFGGKGKERIKSKMADLQSDRLECLLLETQCVGKTSIVHLITKGSSIAHPSQTVGCTVDVKHTTYGSSGSSSSSIKGDMERDFFVELWDISGHERYKDCRSLFYSQINGMKGIRAEFATLLAA
ncbi:sphingosine N-acyltransferase subunit lip1 [Orobanche gracilis]